MLSYTIHASRIDKNGSEATCKSAKLVLDTGLQGREDAFNPAELLLASLAACILKNIERIAPMIQFEYRSVTVKVDGVRQDSPPIMASIEYEIIVDTDEDERKLTLMHENICKFGTLYNTIAVATRLHGILRRQELR